MYGIDGYWNPNFINSIRTQEYISEEDVDAYLGYGNEENLTQAFNMVPTVTSVTEVIQQPELFSPEDQIIIEQEQEHEDIVSIEDITSEPLPEVELSEPALLVPLPLVAVLGIKSCT